MADEKKLLNTIEERIEEKADTARSRLAVTVGVGVVLCLIIVFYFSWLNSKLTPSVTPDALANMAVSYIDEEIMPQVRPTVTQQLRSSAPTVVESAADQMVQTIPTGRKAIEDFLIEQTDQSLIEAEQKLDQLALTALRQSPDQLRATTKRLTALLSDDSKPLSQVEQELYDLILDRYEGSEAQAQLQHSLDTLQQLENKLNELKSTENPTEIQKAQLRFLQTMREFVNRQGKRA
ncbi:MAG: hypothetical protein RLY93_00600 [Sumerlaeia bacterium]